MFITFLLDRECQISTKFKFLLLKYPGVTANLNEVKLVKNVFIPFFLQLKIRQVEYRNFVHSVEKLLLREVVNFSLDD